MKKNGKRFFRKFIPVIICLSAGIFLFSCSNQTADSSFLSALDSVDSLIRFGQTEDAVKLLKKTSKSAYSAYARLGIYKRYEQLGEKALAEKTLEKALKKIPDSKEIRAVYAHFLQKNGRLEQALSVSSTLRGTQYASVYALCLLKTKSKDDFFSSELSEIYRDCYEATKNEKWLLNAALPFLARGEYAVAAAFQDKIDCAEKLFWAKVQFDAGNYDLCVQNLENTEKKSLSQSAVMLASDAYWLLGDYDSAEKAREKLIAQSELEYTSEIPELTFVNSAIWSYNAKQYVRAYDLLMKVIFKNPENVPALLTYGKFAWADSFDEKQDFLEQELRKTTLRTYSMQQKDERPRFLMSDAIYKIENFLENRKKTGVFADDELIVECLDLWLKQNSSLVQNKKEAEIWKTLENNEIKDDMYPPELVNFAVTTLLNFGKEQDARELFSKYLDSRYKMNPAEKENAGGKTVYDVFGGEKKYTAPAVPDFVIKAAFGDRAADYARTMEIWEIETAAYFSILDENFNAARRLYEYALFEIGGINNIQKGEQIVAFSRLASVNSAVNLASIYEATGELDKALSLYGLASGRTRNKNLKSKILYRTALVQKDMQNTEGAVMSLEYALSLNPLNAEARLLEKKLKGE